MFEAALPTDVCCVAHCDVTCSVILRAITCLHAQRDTQRFSAVCQCVVCYGAHQCATFSWIDAVVSIAFNEFGLKMPIHARKIGFGGRDP